MGSDQQVDDLAGVGRDDPGIALKPGLEQGQPGLRLFARRASASGWRGGGWSRREPGRSRSGAAGLRRRRRCSRPRSDSACDLRASLSLTIRRAFRLWSPATIRRCVASRDRSSSMLRLIACSSCPSASACDRVSSSVEPGHPRVFLTQPRQVSRGGSDLVPQLFLVDLGQHVASLDRPTDRHRDLPEPTRRRRRDLEHGLGTLGCFGSRIPRPSSLSGTCHQNENAPKAPRVRNAAARKNQLCSGTTRSATLSCSNASTGRSSSREASPWDDRLAIE